MKRKIPWLAILQIAFASSIVLRTLWVIWLHHFTDRCPRIWVSVLALLLLAMARFGALHVKWNPDWVRKVVSWICGILICFGWLDAEFSTLLTPIDEYTPARYSVVYSGLATDLQRWFPKELSEKQPSMQRRYPFLQGASICAARCFVEAEEYDWRMNQARAAAKYRTEGSGMKENDRYYVPSAWWAAEGATFDNMEVLILESEETGSHGVRWNHGRMLVVAGREETGEMIWLAEDW